MLASLMKRLHQPIYALRLRALVPLMTAHLRENDQLLDVGCGGGRLGRAIMESPSCPARVTVTGLEVQKRDGEQLIPVINYDGGAFPFPESAFDVVILADVLHHAEEPHRLIGESLRVARRGLLIKDHKIDGPLAYPRLAFIDWAANAPYDVACLYRYNAAEQWAEWYERHDLVVEHELHALRLYPPIVNLLFGGRLQYFAYVRRRIQTAEANE